MHQESRSLFVVSLWDKSRYQPFLIGMVFISIFSRRNEAPLQIQERQGSATGPTFSVAPPPRRLPLAIPSLRIPNKQQEDSQSNLPYLDQFPLRCTLPNLVRHFPSEVFENFDSKTSQPAKKVLEQHPRTTSGAIQFSCEDIRYHARYSS